MNWVRAGRFWLSVIGCADLRLFEHIFGEGVSDIRLMSQDGTILILRQSECREIPRRARGIRYRFVGSKIN
jgi:hypothetical protein